MHKHIDLTDQNTLKDYLKMLKYRLENENSKGGNNFGSAKPPHKIKYSYFST